MTSLQRELCRSLAVDCGSVNMQYIIIHWTLDKVKLNMHVNEFTVEIILTLNYCHVLFLSFFSRSPGYVTAWICLPVT